MKKFKKIIGYSILAIVVISIISAIFTSDELKIEGINITKVSNMGNNSTNSQISETNGTYLFDLSGSKEVYITAKITGENFNNSNEEYMNELELVFSDSKTAAVNTNPSDMFRQPDESDNAKFAIKLLNKGKTNVYIQTKDGKVKSEPIKIVVTDLASLNGSSLTDAVNELKSIGFTAEYTDSFGNDITETIKKYAEKDMKDLTVIKLDKINMTAKTVAIKLDTNEATKAEITTEKETTKPSTTKKKTKKETTKPSTTEKKTEKETKKDKSRTVYTTPYGKKYHYSKECAGKNAIKHTLNEVKGAYGPCKKCAQ